MEAEDLDSIFDLPVSTRALEELLNLQTDIQSIPWEPENKDSWVFIWGNQVYSSRRYYHMVYQNLQCHPIFKMLWQSKSTPRIKFFAWLLFVDRLNTRSMLLGRNFHVQPTAFCVLCNLDVLEDIDHLFFSCPFAVSCWNKLGIQWNLQLDTNDRVLQAAQLFHTVFFMDFFIMAAWEIWNIRIPRSLTMGLLLYSFGCVNLKNKASFNS